MGTTMIVTKNVPDRVRGFLASCMVEISAGVYVAPAMNKRVRLRIWEVMTKWAVGQNDDSAVLVWTDHSLAAGMAVLSLGTPSRDLVVVDDVVLARRPLTEDEERSLTTELEPVPF